MADLPRSPFPLRDLRRFPTREHPTHGLIFPGVSGATIALLLLAPVPALGVTPAPPFPNAVIGYFSSLGEAAPAAVAALVALLALASPAAAWLFGRNYGRFTTKVAGSREVGDFE